MQQYIIEVIRGERKGFIAGILGFFLLILSWIYYLIVELRYFFYKIKIIKSQKVACPVISVGNITAGGTGKTPAVISIAKMLDKENRKVIVLSRGYKSKTDNLSGHYDIKVVSDGGKILLSSELAGDEPFLIAENLKGCGVVVGKDRVKCTQVAINKLGAGVFILDDGFGHIRLERDLDIVVIDCLDPFGHGHLLPRGFLREPLRFLKRADVLLLNRVEQVSSDELEKIKSELRKINQKALLVKSIQKVYALERVKRQLQVEEEQIDLLQGRNIVSVCSIGNPLSFEMTLDSLGARIVKKLRFPDHYHYTEETLRSIFKQAGDNSIVTTEKDAVRMKDNISEVGEILILKISLEITEGYEELRDLIISKLS